MTQKQQTILYDYYKPMFKINLHTKSYYTNTGHFDTDIIINNTFLSIFKNIDQYRGEYIKHPTLDCNIHSTFKAWIFTILKRSVIDYYRHVKRYNTSITLTDNLPERSIPESIDIEYDSILQVILNSLPTKQKSIFIDYIEGYTYKEIQEKYSIAYGTAKFHISDARQHIKNKYNIFDWSKKYTMK